MNDKRDEKAGNLQNGSAPPAFLFVRGRAELTWFYGFNLSAARLQFAFSKLASRYWGVDGRGKWQVNARSGRIIWLYGFNLSTARSSLL